MSISVEHAQLLLQTPETRSSAEVGVTKADIQPSGQTVGTARDVAVSVAAFSIVGSVIALQWTQDTLTISVDSAPITIAPQTVDGRRGIPVVSGAPTIAGQNILFQLSSGDWDVVVDTGIPTISGQDVVLEDNRNFVAGAPVLTPQNIVLSENAVVVSTALSITGQDVSLIWDQDSLLVISASPTIQGQDIGLNKSWSIGVDSASPTIAGQNVMFDWVVPNTIVVETALISPIGQNIGLARDIDVTSTALSIAGQTIGRNWGTVVEQDNPSIVGSDISLLFDYLLGYAFSPAQVGMNGSSVDLYLGSGAPTLYKLTHSYPAIEITLQSPRSVKYQNQERVVNG